jgi:cell division protein FtsI (penicillin-binding protein 3)
VLSFTDVIVESSNVGAIKIGFKVGKERLGDYVQRFGFGRSASPDFPGESSGLVATSDKWSDGTLASISMGYEIGVTPLQMASAVSSVANGGQLVEPRIIRAIYRDNRRYAVEPKILRRTITSDTAAVLTGIMEGVVERGTGTAARIPGYTIAGKTGTAAKLVNHHYSKSDYNGSFVGFVPSRDPAITIIVVLDSPHGPHGYFGGNVSAPIFKKIAEAALRYLGVGPTIDPPAPILVDRNLQRGLVVVNLPAPKASAADKDATEPGTVPDLSGLTAREALRRMVALGLMPRVSGDGVVVSQDPPAGSPLDPGTVCRLVLNRVSALGDPGGHP